MAMEMLRFAVTADGPTWSKDEVFTKSKVEAQTALSKEFRSLVLTAHQNLPDDDDKLFWLHQGAAAPGEGEGEEEEEVDEDADGIPEDEEVQAFKLGSSDSEGSGDA